MMDRWGARKISVHRAMRTKIVSSFYLLISNGRSSVEEEKVKSKTERYQPLNITLRVIPPKQVRLIDVEGWVRIAGLNNKSRRRKSNNSNLRNTIYPV